MKLESVDINYIIGNVLQYNLLHETYKSPKKIIQKVLDTYLILVYFILILPTKSNDNCESFLLVYFHLSNTSLTHLQYVY